MKRKRPTKIHNLLDLIKGCVDSGRYRETVHAQERKSQRNIILTEILHVLRTGYHEKRKDQFDEAFNSWNYSVRGNLVDSENVRVIVSFDEEKKMLIITAIRLDG